MIRRCLDALTSQGTEPATSCSLEIAVVCNGCTDDTAAVARKFPGVTVVELPEPSKSAALNAGDDTVTAFPRIYLDADSELSNQSMGSLLRKAAAHADPAIFSASLKFDVSKCSLLTRSFNRCAQRTSFGEYGIVGRGVYVLNSVGRARFGKFPEFTGDDYFVASLFKADEQIIDTDAIVIVRPPRDLRSLVRVRSRIYYGNRQAGLERSRNVSPRQGWRNVAYAALQAHSPGQVADLAVYVGVNLAAKRAASKVTRSGRSVAWQRDDGARAIGSDLPGGDR